MEVLECVAVHQPIGVSEVSRRVEMPKSTAQRLLLALADAGWVSRIHGDTSSWQLTVRAVLLGRHSGNQLGLRDVALHHMELLRQETGESVHLGLAREASIILLERLESQQAVRYLEPYGSASSIFLTATGKAILASTPTKERLRLFADYAEDIAAAEVDQTQLLEELETIRKDGYSSTTRWREGVFATAAAIRNDGLPIAALSLSAPLTRVSEENKIQYGHLVRSAADAIGSELRIRS